MKHKARIAALSASLLIMVGGGHALRASSAPPAEHPTRALSVTRASVTIPDAASPQDPVVLQGSPVTSTRGLSQSASAVGSNETLRPEVVNAYTKAVALAPAACHLSVSLLAAIGQVESGNLATSTIIDNRVVPGVLGPVLDGHGFARIPDTDDGRWDGNTSWDRALGPMQLVPASWRVVGLDLDDDGIRDPQNVFDAAGAAMVYLCSGGRDLATAGDLTDAVLDYNHSVRYLHLVLAWQTVFEATDITGLRSEPVLGAWALPALPDHTLVSGGAGVRDKEPSQPSSTKSRSTARSSASKSTPHSSAPLTRTGPVGSGAHAGDVPGSSAGPTPDPGGRPGPDPDPKSGPKSDPKTDPKTDPETGPATDPATDPATAPVADPPASCLPEDPTSLEPGVDPDVVPDAVPDPVPVPEPVPGVVPSLTPEDGTPPDPCDPPVPDEAAASQAPSAP